MAAVHISPEDLSSFHAAHFSAAPSDHFSHHFLGPVEEEYQEEEADDLGYYPDGTKRTLTDEQIAIFRHSEIETLLRERRHAKEARENSSEEEPLPEPVAEEGEIEVAEFNERPILDSPITDMPTPPSADHTKLSKNKKKKLAQKAKQRKAEQAKEKGFFKQNVKPDLRKRTWDKVEAGLGNLDYDEACTASSAPSRPAQRRRISYDDD